MNRTSLGRAVATLLVGLALAGCSNTTEPEKNVNIPAIGSQYVVFAWNNLGMHCLNPTYDEAVILPPYNTVWVQIVKRGDPPEIVNGDMTVDYRIINNTYSSGKTDSYGGDFAQFWQYCQALFGITLEVDTGLNLENPDVHNGLSGRMVVKGDHFEVDGIPVVPVTDDGLWQPYQVMEVTVKSGGTVIGSTRATVPTSDEINCAKCHGSEPFHDILVRHDKLHETTLTASAPLVCANETCHGSPALGESGSGENGYLSAVIHRAHATRETACMDCHPGPVTQCNRSLAHTAPNGHCMACHGTLDQVASSIEEGFRVPWADETKCSACHTGVPKVDTGELLYRDSVGHGGMYCAACHGSPHAMYPSRESKDNYQPLQYQSSSKSIGSCGVCHENSRGGGASDFGEAHVGSGGRPTACSVCHTAVSTNTTSWPHEFGWTAR